MEPLNILFFGDNMRYCEFMNKQLDEIYIRQDIGNFEDIPFEMRSITNNRKS